MKKILILLILSLNVAHAQIRIGVINGDTTTRPLPDLAALAWKNNDLYVIRPSGNAVKMQKANDYYSNNLYLKISNNLSDLSNVGTAKTNLGLSNVDNTSDINKPISSATQIALNAKENSLSKGNITSNDITITGGTGAIIGSGVVLTLSSNGRIRHFTGAGDVTNTISSQANIGDIYFDTTNGVVYQKSNLSFPSGVVYITLSSGTWVKLGDYALNKSKVGLDNVDNTSDLNKPISNATQAALDTKLNSSTAASTYLPLSGGTLTGILTLSNSVRVGGTGSTDNNTFLGKNTLISRTSGTGNTAIGQASLSSSTSGSNNTVVGSNSGASLTTGQGNTIIGNGLASAITTGSYNTVIGAGSITGLTSGSSNNVIIADGQGNRRLNIFSDGNTMIGSNTYYGETRLGVFGGVNGANLDIRGNSGAFVDQSTVEVEGNDYDTNTRSAYLQYRGSTYTGTSNGFSNNNLARLIMNGNNNLIMTGLTKPLIFGTNFTESMRIDSLGRIGIGTLTPTKRLTVASQVGDYGVYISGSGTAGNNNGILIDAGLNTSDYALRVRSGTTSEYFAVRGDGNVGIGTSTPATKLDINGDLRVVNGGKFTGQAGSWYPYGQVLIDYASNQGRIQSYDGSTSQNKDLLLQWNGGNVGVGTNTPTSLLHLKSTNPIIRLEGSTTSGYIDFNDTRMNVHAGGGYMSLIAGNSEKMRIDATGNIGIGTSNPYHKLQIGNGTFTSTVNSSFGIVSADATDARIASVSGTGYAAVLRATNAYSELFSYNYSGSVANNLIIQQYGGNVGIGTTSPLAKLDNRGDIHVSNGSTTKTRIRTGGIIDFTNFAESAYADASITANNLSLLGGSGLGAYITTAGSFGVGISSPSSKFHIYGTGYVAETIQTTATNAGAITNYITGSRSYSAGGRSDFSIGAYHIVDETAGISRFMINNGGNTGIGTTTPEQRLHVEGLIKTKGYTTTEINALTGMTAGTLVYNTTLNMFCFYNGSAWKRMDGTTNM